MNFFFIKKNEIVRVADWLIPLLTNDSAIQFDLPNINDFFFAAQFWIVIFWKIKSLVVKYNLKKVFFSRKMLVGRYAAVLDISWIFGYLVAVGWLIDLGLSFSLLCQVHEAVPY